METRHEVQDRNVFDKQRVIILCLMFGIQSIVNLVLHSPVDQKVENRPNDRHQAQNVLNLENKPFRNVQVLIVRRYQLKQTLRANVNVLVTIVAIDTCQQVEDPA